MDKRKIRCVMSVCARIWADSGSWSIYHIGSCFRRDIAIPRRESRIFVPVWCAQLVVLQCFISLRARNLYAAIEWCESICQLVCSVWAEIPCSIYVSLYVNSNQRRQHLYAGTFVFHTAIALELWLCAQWAYSIEFMMMLPQPTLGYVSYTSIEWQTTAMTSSTVWIPFMKMRALPSSSVYCWCVSTWEWNGNECWNHRK